MNDAELLDWVTNDIDGRFWLDDRIDELIRGTRQSRAFDMLMEDHENALAAADEAAGEMYWESGYEEGRNDGYSDGHGDGYNEGVEDGEETGYERGLHEQQVKNV